MKKVTWTGFEDCTEMERFFQVEYSRYSLQHVGKFQSFIMGRKFAFTCRLLWFIGGPIQERMKKEER